MSAIAALHDGQLVYVEIPDMTGDELVARRAAIADRRVRRAPPLDGRAFLARLTDGEYTAIVAAATADVRLARWIEDLRMVGAIHLGGDVALAAKAAVVAAGLLTKARADLIFAP